MPPAQRPLKGGNMTDTIHNYKGLQAETSNNHLVYESINDSCLSRGGAGTSHESDNVTCHLDNNDTDNNINDNYYVT